MESLFLLVPLSVLLVGVAALLFLRAVRTRQFDDLDRHALDILDDEEQRPR